MIIMYRALVGFALGMATREIVVGVRRAAFPTLQRHRELWHKVNTLASLLNEDDRGLLAALKVRLDAGLELHSQHEKRLNEMREKIEEDTAL